MMVRLGDVIENYDIRFGSMTDNRYQWEWRGRSVFEYHCTLKEPAGVTIAGTVIHQSRCCWNLGVFIWKLRLFVCVIRYYCIVYHNYFLFLLWWTFLSFNTWTGLYLSQTTTIIIIRGNHSYALKMSCWCCAGLLIHVTVFDLRLCSQNYCTVLDTTASLAHRPRSFRPSHPNVLRP